MAPRGGPPLLHCGFAITAIISAIAVLLIVVPVAVVAAAFVVLAVETSHRIRLARKDLGRLVGVVGVVELSADGPREHRHCHAKKVKHSNDHEQQLEHEGRAGIVPKSLSVVMRRRGGGRRRKGAAAGARRPPNRSAPNVLHQRGGKDGGVGALKREQIINAVAKQQKSGDRKSDENEQKKGQKPRQILRSAAINAIENAKRRPHGGDERVETSKGKEKQRCVKVADRSRENAGGLEGYGVQPQPQRRSGLGDSVGRGGRRKG